MSRYERKYRLWHILVILLIFAAITAINLVPRSEIQTAECQHSKGATQSVKITSRGWPLAYSQKFEAKKICFVFENGRLQNIDSAHSHQELHVPQLILNEAIALAVVIAFLWFTSWRMSRRNA